MTDRNRNQNQPKSGQQKNPNQTRDDQQWDETSGKGSTGRDRSTEEPASVADDRGNIVDRSRRNLDGDTERSQQESGMNDPVSDTNRNDRSENPDRDR